MIAYGECLRFSHLTVWLVAAALTIVLAGLTIAAWKQGLWGRMHGFTTA
jgi:hypothetical protein